MRPRWPATDSVVKGGHRLTISKAQMQAVAKYNSANYDRVELRLEKGKKAVTKAHAAAQGESLNAFINRAINETMERDCTAEKEADV